jgi:hypothetical protein
VWIAKGAGVPPVACAKCKSRTWNRAREPEKIAEAKAAQTQPEFTITLDAAQRIIPLSIVNELPPKPLQSPRCPTHRLPMILNTETMWWSCRVTKCRQHADDEAVRLARETADYASM